MKFNQLNKKAQERAVKDYVEGWKETHPKETMSTKEAQRLCDEEEMNYNKQGKYLGEKL
jgi:uncharacterized short protein YbdD (DUF466 family)